MYEIEFTGAGGRAIRVPLPGATLSDEAITSARAEAEKVNGEPLADDPKTAFPSFVLYRDGEEVGGG